MFADEFSNYAEFDSSASSEECVINRLLEAHGRLTFMTMDTHFRSLFNYTKHMLSFLNYRQESLFYLEKIYTSLHWTIYGLEQLAMGKLTHIPPTTQCSAQIPHQNFARGMTKPSPICSLVFGTSSLL